MAQDLLRDRVKCAVPNPGAVAVGSTITLGAAPNGYRTFLTAFAPGGVPAYFVLADGTGRTIGGIWTVNATNPETATITEIIVNDLTGGTGGTTFAGACTAWNAIPADEVLVIRSGPMAGLRNLLINANPNINQRVWTSGAATAVANKYTLDRWRIPTSGQAISWTDVGSIRTVTAPAGGVEQVVEGASIRGGTYTLSWTGTATALVNGAAVANGAQVTLPSGANATVRFYGGTFSLPMLEPGPRKTPFEFRPFGLELMLCQRYATSVELNIQLPAVGALLYSFFFPVFMRATPTLEANLAAGVAVNASINFESATTQRGGYFQVTSATASGSVVSRINLYTSEL